MAKANDAFRNIREASEELDVLSTSYGSGKPSFLRSSRSSVVAVVGTTVPKTLRCSPPSETCCTFKATPSVAFSVCCVKAGSKHHLRRAMT